MRAVLFLVLALSTAGCQLQSDSATPNDNRELFWSGKVNVDPLGLPISRGSPGLRTAIELEVGGVSGVVGANDRLHDYDVVVGTASLAPEIMIQDWVSVTPLLGYGRHDVEATLETLTSLGRQPSRGQDQGGGMFAAIEVTLEPTSWLRVFGRFGTYDGDQFEQEFVEAGVKFGVGPGWVFAAWRSSELDFAAWPERLNAIQNLPGDVEVSGLLIGTELRF